MKSLILASVLAVGLSFPLVSQAEVNAFGVHSSATSEVSDSINGGYVAQNLSDTFQVQKLQSSNESKSANSSYYEDTYYVFGVALDNGNVI